MARLSYPWGDVGVGTVLRHACTFTEEDVAVYDDLSQRHGSGGHRDLPDLLLVAPLTKLGGDLDYLSREMTWTTHGRVPVGERIEAELEVRELTERDNAYAIAFDARIRAGDGSVVVTGRSRGLILKNAPAASGAAR